MWELINRTPFEAERTWIVDRDGRKHWAVVVKAAFDIAPDGTTTIADEQVAPNAEPKFNGEEFVSSLRYEMDLIHTKPGTDLYVNGSAHAPNGKPVESLTVGVQVGNRQKALTVVGDRHYTRDVTSVEPSLPLPFVAMPIVYERAYGGFDDTNPDPMKQKLFEPNPIGVGVAVSSSTLLGTPAPNILVPGQAEDARAAGFGAIGPHWAPRCRFAGTYDGAWIEQRKPLLPLDYDARFAMCAPADQQFSPHLRGGETVGVVNMNPAGSVRFVLPKHAFGLTTYFGNGRPKVHHRPTLQTVVIEPEVPRVLMVWQSQIECHHDMDYLERTLIREKVFV